MTKLALQKELLEKIKPGTKPSDLKKPKNSQIPTPPTSPLIEPIKPNQDQATAPDLPSQISSLQNQLQLYKDFKEADLKIKEQYKQTISKLEAQIEKLNKTITNLKNQTKNPEENPVEIK